MSSYDQRSEPGTEVPNKYNLPPPDPVGEFWALLQLVCIYEMNLRPILEGAIQVRDISGMGTPERWQVEEPRWLGTPIVPVCDPGNWFQAISEVKLTRYRFACGLPTATAIRGIYEIGIGRSPGGVVVWWGFHYYPEDWDRDQVIHLIGNDGNRYNYAAKH